MNVSNASFANFELFSKFIEIFKAFDTLPAVLKGTLCLGLPSVLLRVSGYHNAVFMGVAAIGTIVTILRMRMNQIIHCNPFRLNY